MIQTIFKNESILLKKQTFNIPNIKASLFGRHHYRWWSYGSTIDFVFADKIMVKKRI